MGKNIAAVGIFAEDESVEKIAVPDDIDEVVAALDKIVDKYEMGDTLSEEDKKIVVSYLPAIGVDETSLSDENAFVGKGSFDFDKEDKDIQMHIKGECGCEGVGEGRIEWWSNIWLEKTGGSNIISKYAFDIRGASFGMGPTGKLKLIYKRDFKREFPGSESAFTSFYDRYVFTQWGFYFSCSCTLSTPQGDVIIK